MKYEEKILNHARIVITSNLVGCNTSYEDTMKELISLREQLPLELTLSYLSSLDLRILKNKNDTKLNITLLDEITRSKNNPIKSILLSKNNNIFFSLEQIHFAINFLVDGCSNTNCGINSMTNEEVYKIKDLLPVLLLKVNDILFEFNNKENTMNSLWKIKRSSNNLNINYVSEIGRFNLVFKGDHRRKLSDFMFSKLNISLEDFEKVSSFIFINILATQSTTFEIKNLFYQFGEELVNKYFDIMSLNEENKNLESYPFYLSSLNEGNYFCLSPSNFVLNMTNNLLRKLYSKCSNKEESLLGNIVGDAFSDYVVNLVSSAERNSIVSPTYNRIEVSDILIPKKQNIFFFEIKAKKLEYKNSPYFSIENSMKKFLVDKEKGAAKQISKRIEEFKQGITIVEGLNPQNFTKYYPVLISTFDEIPQMYLLNEEYEKILKKHNIFQEKEYAPFQILSIEDIEILVILMKKGFSLEEIFKIKLSNNFYKQMPLSFMVSEDKKFIGFKNTYHIKILSESFQSHLKDNYQN